jgi:6-phosphogluconolactonase
VFDAMPEMAARAVNQVERIAEEAIAGRGRFTAALSGGTTPVELYTRLGREGRLPWDTTHIFLVDERFVPFSDPRSNYGMIRRTLLGCAAIPAANVHPYAITDAGPDGSARLYEQELLSFFGARTPDLPCFDLVLLGVGEDGHTASLFPGSPALQERQRLVLAIPPTKTGVARLTFTLPVINAGRTICFFVAGSSKANAVKGVADEGDARLPASHVRANHGRLIVFCDKQAAALLSS